MKEELGMVLASNEAKILNKKMSNLRYLIDPLQLKPKTRTVALAAMIGAVILAMALGESVTIEGIVL